MAGYEGRLLDRRELATSSNADEVFLLSPLRAWSKAGYEVGSSIGARSEPGPDAE